MQSLCPAIYLLSVLAHYITHLGPIWTPSQPQNGQRQALKHHVFPCRPLKWVVRGQLTLESSMQSLCPATYLLSVQAHYITHLGPIWTPSQPQNGQRQALKHHVFLTVLVRVWIMPPAHPPPSIQQIVYQFFQTIVLVDHQGIQGPATGTITFCLTYFMFPNII